MLIRTIVLMFGAFALAPAGARAGCSPVASSIPRVWLTGADDNGITVTFLGHASFLIETPGHVTAVTDYNGYNVPSAPPDIATMNHAHGAHYTDFPDPRIRYVLRGWRDNGGPAEIDLTYRDMHVTNVPTNIRDWSGGTEAYGNSIFVFESAGVCIAHLGHLHHLLEPHDVYALGHIDVVMAPVDGAYTLSQQDIAAVLEQLQPRLVLPMHYFNRFVLQRFLELVRDRYDEQVSSSPTLRIARTTLPDRPTVIVLPGE
ncbi:MAG: MBL fold metallo-hydrolase [Acetobacteraceae bacterium]|nr:MBL fold metallo-hydrolase [Acetobacteraceae bacterium]